MIIIKTILLSLLIAFAVLFGGIEVTKANDQVYQVSFPIVSSKHEVDRVMPFGDSLTRGFPYLPGYREYLPSSLAVVGGLCDDGCHEGHGGATIHELSELVQDVISLYHPNIVIVMAGSNDLLQDGDLAEMISEMDSLINRISSSAEIILVTIPPIKGMETQSKIFNKELTDLAEQRGIKLVSVSYEPNDYYIDGVHLNKRGYKKLGLAIADAIK